MKIRIMGTEEECAAFVEMVKKTIPRSYIRNISCYPNVRKCSYSNEGRVYIDVDRPVISKTGFELPGVSD